MHGQTTHHASPTTAVIKAFTPTGTLRACINLGNPILAHRDPQSGAVSGVSVDLAHQLAAELHVPIELVVVDAAGKSVDIVTQERADLGFFAFDPVRGAGITFTAPYVLIEGCYLVHRDAPIQRNEQVDAPGHTVVVGKGSAYDLYLSRELKHAQIHRAATSPTVVDTYQSLIQADPAKRLTHIAAGVKQQLQADRLRLAATLTDPQPDTPATALTPQRAPNPLNLLDGRFMVIQQAMGQPKDRDAQARAYLADFVERMKASGFVAQALARHRINGASVAPGV